MSYDSGSNYKYPKQEKKGEAQWNCGKPTYPDIPARGGELKNIQPMNGVTESEISSLRYLLNKAEEAPKSHVGGILDCIDSSRISNRFHLENLWKKLTAGASFLESVISDQLDAAIEDYNEAKKEVKSKDNEIGRIKMIIESEYRKKKAKMQYREKEIEHYWQQFKKDHNL